jgi:putative copper resistance protein D
MSPETGLAVCRFLHDASAMLLWGCFALLWTLVPRELARDTAQRLEGFRLIAAAVAILTALAALPLETAMVGTGWEDALRPATVKAVLFETSIGSAWLIEMAMAVLLLAAALFARNSRPGATALAAGLMVAALATSGHAVMHEGWLGVGHRITDAVHALSAGAWIGALVALLPILGALGRQTQQADAAIALRRFSTAGHGVVALVLASGIANTLLVLGHLPTDWSSPYQAMLAAKIVLVAAMACLALANRYVFAPRLQRQPGAAASIRRGTIGELALGAGVLGLVSVFGMLEPY